MAGDRRGVRHDEAGCPAAFSAQFASLGVKAREEKGDREVVAVKRLHSPMPSFLNCDTQWLGLPYRRTKESASVFRELIVTKTQLRVAGIVSAVIESMSHSSRMPYSARDPG